MLVATILPNILRHSRYQLISSILASSISYCHRLHFHWSTLKYYQQLCIGTLSINSSHRFISYFNLNQQQKHSFHTTIPMATILSGKDLADEVKASLKAEVDELPIKPTLAIVQVGDRSDSNVYIRMKKTFGDSVGVQTIHFQLPSETTQQELADQIQKFNQDKTIHGIIAQLPFDSKEPIDSHYIINLIVPHKDVDCLTAVNAGNLMHGLINEPFTFLPCTPNGCLQLIQKSGVTIAGANVVVIGRSKIVGAPMAQLLIWNDATVTLCHKKTKDLPDIVRRAEILVVAIGCPLFIKKDWIKPGAVVIDCGVSSIDDPTKKAGYRLVGDVDYDNVKEVASFITPVPGGVGPMTVAMLIANTVKAAQRASTLSN